MRPTKSLKRTNDVTMLACTFFLLKYNIKRSKLEIDSRWRKTWGKKDKGERPKDKIIMMMLSHHHYYLL